MMDEWMSVMKILWERGFSEIRGFEMKKWEVKWKIE